jgi:hypothetical protein
LCFNIKRQWNRRSQIKNIGVSTHQGQRRIVHKVNYFDERLSAFGEEDGDMHYKHIEATGKRIPSLNIPNIFNKAAYYFRNEKIETFVDNKPRLNREVANLMYVADPNGIVNPMDPTKTPVKKIAENTPQYPHEMFVIKNKHNIEKFEKVVF